MKVAEAIKPKVRSEEGTSPASVIIVLILVLLIFELVVVGGRVAAAYGNVGNAAREAARRGTVVQSAHEVSGAVHAVAWANLNAGNRPQCTSLHAHYAPPAYDYEAFAPGKSVTAQVSCTVDLSDMSAFGLPLPDLRIEAEHTEIIETYRAVGEP